MKSCGGLFFVGGSVHSGTNGSINGRGRWKIGHKEVLERVIKITIMPEIQLRFPVVDENQYQKSNRLFHGILFGNAIMFKKNLRCHIIDVWPWIVWGYDVDLFPFL